MHFSPEVDGSSSSYSSPASSTKEFSLRAPKNTEVKYQLMKFNSNLNIDFTKLSHAKMERDINKADGRLPEEDMPKFGAGSEFGLEARQEARKRRYGGNKKVSESSPWLLKTEGKKYKGVREGGITDHSSYYLFMHGDDGVINAHKLEEWYNFKPVQCYKTLTVEEAEEVFESREKVLNHFTLMLQKRLKKEDIEEEVDDDEKTKGKKWPKNRKSKELKIFEMEEWDLSEDEESVEDVLDEDKAEKKKKEKQKTKTKVKPRKKCKGSDESATEESDDGDEEGKELDYISDSSDEVSDDEEKVTKQMQGVSEEKALKSLLTSDEDEEEDEEKTEERSEDKISCDVETDEKSSNKDGIKPKQSAPKGKKKKNIVKKANKECDSESESSVDSSDIDNEPIRKRPLNFDAMKSNGDPIVFSNVSSNQSLKPAQKKARVEFSPVSDTHGITEEAVRRYLSRKPITATQLLTKLKNRSNLRSEQLVSAIALLLKKINPEKKMIKNKMYFLLNHA